MRFRESVLFNKPNTNFPRAETLIIESTYGNKEDIFPEYDLVVQHFVDSINSALTSGGTVLILTPHIGLAQEISIILDRQIGLGRITKVDVLIEKAIADVSSIHEVYSDYLSGEMNNQVNQGDKNPFQSKFNTIVESHRLGSEPAIIISPLLTTDGGPSLHYLKQLSQREENKIILTSYQMPGSIGRFIQEGGRQISINGQEIKLRSSIEIMEGLDVHSDYGQLIGFVSRLRHKLRRVLVNHGERSRVQNLASSINRMLKIQTQHPLVLEAIKLI
jgi:uncharacterized protein